MGGRARALLERRLRSARHLRQHFQSFNHRLFAHVVAADCTESAFLVSDAAVACSDRQMHQSDRLARRRAAGSGDAGDRNRQINIGMFERAERHCGRSFLADRAECLSVDVSTPSIACLASLE